MQSVKSHWTYLGKILEEEPEGTYGFVYRITNTINGKKYIGRKNFTRVKRKKVSGRVNRRVIVKRSDWKTYTGSNKRLNADIEKCGIDKFEFEILAFANTKGQLNYLEENFQHRLHVLFDSDYYNDSIGSRRFVSMKSDEHFSKTVRDIDL